VEAVFAHTTPTINPISDSNTNKAKSQSGHPPHLHLS
jgi:hypothetical protein